MGLEMQPKINLMSEDLVTFLGDYEIIHVPGFSAGQEIPLVDMGSLNNRLEISGSNSGGLINSIGVMMNNPIKIKTWFSKKISGHLKGFRVGELLVLCSADYKNYNCFTISTNEKISIQTGTSISEYGIVVAENVGNVMVGMADYYGINNTENKPKNAVKDFYILIEKGV